MGKNNVRLNNQIKRNTTNVRIVGEIDEIEKGVYSIEDALIFAKKYDLDLVEISPNANPPVVKIMDYKKYLYDKNKKQKEQEKKQKQNNQQLKEIRFTPNTDDHDFEFKLRHARKFIENNNKLKATVFFKGREINFKDKGELILLKLAEKLEDIAIAESLPKLEGKRMIMLFKPKK